jgi:hypothetical protein
MFCPFLSNTFFNDHQTDWPQGINPIVLTVEQQYDRHRQPHFVRLPKDVVATPTATTFWFHAAQFKRTTTTPFTRGGIHAHHHNHDGMPSDPMPTPKRQL